MADNMRKLAYHLCSYLHGVQTLLVLDCKRTTLQACLMARQCPQATASHLTWFHACSDSMVFPGTEDQGKTKMKELFGVPKLRKDGTVGKVSPHMALRLTAGLSATATSSVLSIVLPSLVNQHPFLY